MTAPHNQSPSAGRPIGDYEIKFALQHGAQQWAGIWPGVAFTTARGIPGYTDCAVILPAYSAEDCMVDFWIRVNNCGWRREYVRVISITPAQASEPAQAEVEPDGDKEWEAAQRRYND